MFVDPVPGPASILVAHIPNVNGRLLAQLIFGNERDAHAPASVSTQKPPKLAKRQLVIIDIHDGFAVFAAVTYYASEYVALRDPLNGGTSTSTGIAHMSCCELRRRKARDRTSCPYTQVLFSS